MKAILPLFVWAALAVQPLYAATGDDLLKTGIDYAYGRNGKPKDEAQALSYYLKASSQGNAEATYRVARMYYYGVGTAVDKTKAQAYYTLATQSGHKKAADELHKNFKGKAVPSPTPGADLAPAGVKGKVLLLDYSQAKRSDYSHSTKTYGEEKPWEGDRLGTWEFDKSTTPTFEGGYRITYTKTSPNAATVEVVGWEYNAIYTLHFETATSGTVQEESLDESEKWKTRGIKFTLQNAAR